MNAGVRQVGHIFCELLAKSLWAMSQDRDKTQSDTQDDREERRQEARQVVSGFCDTLGILFSVKPILDWSEQECSLLLWKLQATAPDFLCLCSPARGGGLSVHTPVVLANCTSLRRLGSNTR